MSRILRVSACIAAFLMLSQAAFCYTVKFQQGASNPFCPFYYGAEDTYIDADYPDANFGGAETLYVCGNDDGYHWYQKFGLMRFDLSAMMGQPVYAARLYLYVDTYNPLPMPPEAPYGYIDSYGAAAMPASDGWWRAGASDGQIEQGASCYDWKAYDNTMWDDRRWWQGDWIHFTDTGRTAYGYHEIMAELPASLVGSWIYWPYSGQNAGLKLYFGDTFGSIVSSDSRFLNLRPVLEVDIVPEPSSILVLLGGLGSLVFVRKKR